MVTPALPNSLPDSPFSTNLFRRKEKTMRLRTAWLVLLVVCFAGFSLLASADDKKPDENSTKSASATAPATAPVPATGAAKPAAMAATEEEVEELRAEISSLKAVIAKLEAAVPPPVPANVEEYVGTESEITEAGPLQAKDKKPETV